MNRLLPLYIGVVILGASLWSCNSDSDTDPTNQITASSVAVNAFSLKKNDSVLPHLDSVYFSIDLQKQLIFNADSLPKGTDVSKLIVNISTPSVSACQLIVSRGLQGDTTYNYLQKQNDSIDFTRPVTLRIVSGDGLQTRDYQIKINVHQSAADSLYWNKTLRRDLPTTLSSFTVQKSLEWMGKALCVTTDGSRACAATASHPLGQWDAKACSLPANANLRSLCATTDGTLYILDADGALWSSTDLLQSWNPTGASFTNLLGAYTTEVIGTRRANDGSWTIAGYPSIPEMDAPEGFPVTDSSNMLVFTSKWSDSPMATIVGGKLASGALTGATWAYDGTIWAPLNTDPLRLMQFRNMAIIPYYAFKSDTYWRVDEQSALLAFGGIGALDMLSSTVYISMDRGISWKKADQLMQLPDYIPAMYSADMFCFSSTMTASQTAWQPTPDTKLPAWLSIEHPASRVSKPIDTWECPAIFLCGGVDADGSTYNNMWHGVINRLTYRPLY